MQICKFWPDISWKDKKILTTYRWHAGNSLCVSNLIIFWFFLASGRRNYKFYTGIFDFQYNSSVDISAIPVPPSQEIDASSQKGQSSVNYNLLFVIYIGHLLSFHFKQYNDCGIECYMHLMQDESNAGQRLPSLLTHFYCDLFTSFEESTLHGYIYISFSVITICALHASWACINAEIPLDVDITVRIGVTIISVSLLNFELLQWRLCASKDSPCGESD